MLSVTRRHSLRCMYDNKFLIGKNVEEKIVFNLNYIQTLD